MTIAFDNSYARLPERFFVRQPPVAVAEPGLVAVNRGLAERLGLDAETFFKISSTASGQCWSMTSYCPAPGPVPNAPSNRDYQPGFAAAMMLKDMRLAQEAAHKAKAATPLGAQAEALYALMEAAGKDNLDFSGVMKLIKGSL